MKLLGFLKKKNYLTTFFLVLGLLMVILFSYRVARDTYSSPKSFSPRSSIKPSPLVTETEAQAARDRLLERKENRIPLSSQDQEVKVKLLQLLPQGKNAGVFYQTADYRIEYVEALDLLKVEIVTTNIARAKAEANAWFRAQGMSQQGICNAPISFYLNYDLNKQLGESAETFNPLPPGC